MAKWLALLAQIAPIVLSFTPLAPIAGAVAAGIQAAEQIPGATGDQKKALVQQIVLLGTQATNAQTGKALLDPSVTTAVSGAVIDSVVGTINLVHQAQAAITPVVVV